MPVLVEVRLDAPTMRRAMALLGGVPAGLYRIVPRAINKIGVMARTRTLAMVTEQISIKKKDLRDKNIRLHRASRDNWAATLNVSGNRIPISKFSPSQVRRGVTYRIRRAGGRVLLPGAFMATMPSGHTIAAVRARGWTMRFPRGRKTGVKHGLPLYEPLGPSIPEVVRTAEEFASGQFQDVVAEKLSREVLVQVDVLLGQQAAARGRAG